jgi:hypothetical protein
MNHRKPVRGLKPQDVRDLSEAEGHASRLGYDLRTTINVSPWLLDEYPADLRLFFDDFMNKLRIWCVRHFGFYAIAVRENFEGNQREHFHVLLHVPARERAALEAAVRRWLPGAPEVVTIGKANFKPNRFGQSTNQALTYMLKQMTTQAWAALGRKVRRQRTCSKTGALVAPVMGKRHYVSRSLDAKARQRFAVMAAPIGAAARDRRRAA